MSTPAVTTLIDEQLANIERSFAIIGLGVPVSELLELPRDYRVQDLPKRLSCTFKAKRVTIRSRS